MPEKLKVTGKNAEGEEVTIELASPPPGMMLESAFEERFTDRFAQRATSLQSTARAEAMTDDGFKKKALKAWGIDPDRKPPPEPPDDAERIATLETKWTKEHVEPLQVENKTLAGRIDRLLGTRKRGEIVDAARTAGVKEIYLKTPKGADQPMIVAITGHQFGLHEDTDSFFTRGQKDGEFAFSTKARADRETPYQTLGEFFEAFVDDKENEEYVDTGAQKGPKHKQGGPGAAGPDVWISPADARDHQKFKAAEKLAKDQGGQVRELDA